MNIKPVLNACAGCGVLTKCRSHDNSKVKVKETQNTYLYPSVGRRVYLCHECEKKKGVK